ncbi:hypothetical protein [Citrobacter koseri]|uniref:hypothetical protein n=1 Tax=Citrobacter koseri TaxID=545 RepID=UPI004039E14B
MTDKQAQYRPKFSRIWERYDEAAKDNAVHMREILEQALDALEAAERHIVITERVAGEKLEAKDKQLTDSESRVRQQNRNVCEIFDENTVLRKRIAEQQRSLDQREFLLSSADQVQREYAEALGCAGDNESILEAIDDMKKRIAELESSETQLIDERDNAESALNDAYKAVMGQAPEWSNWFSFADAIDEMELACGLWRNQTEDVIQFRARIAELEAKLQAADKLQDSAFRHGLQCGFSYGQTNDQAGFEQCMASYSQKEKSNGC